MDSYDPEWVKIRKHCECWPVSQCIPLVKQQFSKCNLDGDDLLWQNTCYWAGYRKEKLVSEVNSHSNMPRVKGELIV